MKSLRLAAVLAASLVFGAVAGPDIVRVAAEGTEAPAPDPSVAPEESPAVEPVVDPSAEPSPGGEESVDPPAEEPAPEPSVEPSDDPQESEGEEVANHGAIVRLVANCAPRGKDSRFASLAAKNHGGFVSAAARGGTAEVAGSVVDLSTIEGARALCAALEGAAGASAGEDSTKAAKKAARDHKVKRARAR